MHDACFCGEECMFEDKISDFVQWYSIKNPLNEIDEHGGKMGAAQMNLVGQGSGGGSQGQNAHNLIDKKTVLDLCAHMFHPKESSQDVSITMEYNELKQEEKIKEFENVQGDLIFECFQDEVS